MEEVKIKRYKGSLLLKVAVFCFACFMVTMLVGQQISISQKKDELQQLKNELKEQQVVNDELRYDLMKRTQTTQTMRRRWHAANWTM